MSYPLEHPCLVGTVSITMPPDRPMICLKYRLRATGNFYAHYFAALGSVWGKDRSVRRRMMRSFLVSSGTDYF